MLGFKFAKSCGWIARYWRSQTTGSATGTCNPTVNSVNGNAKIFRRYADRQTLGQHHTDGRLSKLTGINSHRGHQTRSFWQAQSCRLGVSVIRVEVHFRQMHPPVTHMPKHLVDWVFGNWMTQHAHVADTCGFDLAR